MKASAKHLRLAAVKEPVISQGLRIPFDAPSPGSNVRHRAGRGHVAGLALLAFPPRRTGQPFRVSRVNRHSENHSLMAGGTISALVIKGGIGVFPPIHIVQRAEEDLPLARTQKLQPVSSMSETDSLR